MRKKKKTILILLPTLPKYRNDFFSKLVEISRDKLEIIIIHGDRFRDKNIYYENNDRFNSIKCNCIERKILGYYLVYQKGLQRLFSLYKPDVVISLFNPGIISYWIVYIRCMFKGIPFVIWSSGYSRHDINDIKLKIRETIYNFFLLHASAHICYGTKYAEKLKNTGILPSKIFIAQNTINVENILSSISRKNKHNKDYYRKVINVGNEGTLLLFVGALTKSKNLDKAITSFNKLKMLGYNFRFIVIGDGNEKAYLKHLVNNNDLKNAVMIIDGIYDDLLCNYFLAADAFLLPGTGGLVVNEAMAYGLPIISTYGDGTIHDLVFDKRNGFIIGEDNKEKAILDSLIKFMNIDNYKRLIMGFESKKIIKEKAPLSNMVNQFYYAIVYTINI